MVFGKGNPLVFSINRTRRRINKVLNILPSTAFEHVCEANQVTVHKIQGVVQGMADTGLRGQVYYQIEFTLFEKYRHAGTIGQVEFYEIELAYAHPLTAFCLLDPI